MNAQESDGRYVEVTGSSEIEVVPDEIHFLVQIKEYWQEEYTGKSEKAFSHNLCKGISLFNDLTIFSKYGPQFGRWVSV